LNWHRDPPTSAGVALSRAVAVQSARVRSGHAPTQLSSLWTTGDAGILRVDAGRTKAHPNVEVPTLPQREQGSTLWKSGVGTGEAGQRPAADDRTIKDETLNLTSEPTLSAPESRGRIDTHRASGRKDAGNNGHEHQHRRHGDPGNRVGWFHTEEPSPNEPHGDRRTCQPECTSESDKPSSAATAVGAHFKRYVQSGTAGRFPQE
jgi:hypothetical protein